MIVKIVLLQMIVYASLAIPPFPSIHQQVFPKPVRLRQGAWHYYSPPMWLQADLSFPQQVFISDPWDTCRNPDNYLDIWFTLGLFKVSSSLKFS